MAKGFTWQKKRFSQLKEGDFFYFSTQKKMYIFRSYSDKPGYLKYQSISGKKKNYYTKYKNIIVFVRKWN